MPTLPVGRHAHTWFNEPIAIYDNNATYYGVYADGGTVGVARYDHSLQILEVGNPRGQTCPTIQFDDHNNPAILVESTTKRILAGYEHHAGPAWISRSPNANSVRGTWTETQVFDGTGSNYQSYSHFCQTEDNQNTVWQFFRKGTTVGVAMPVTFRISQDAGATWTAQANVVEFLKKTSHRPYFRLAQSGRRIDFLYTDGNPAELTSCSLYHLYLIVNTAGTQFSVYKADGTLVDTFALTGGTGTVNSKTLPLDVSEGTLVYDGTTIRGWVWDCQWIGGSLYGCFATLAQTTVSDDTHRYYRTAYNGTSWTNEAVCYGGDATTSGDTGRIPHYVQPDSPTASQRVYSPGICLDPNDASIAYVGKKSASTTINLQKWTRSGGGTWSYDSAITSDSGVINIRPYPVLGSSPTNIFWTRCSSYPNYDNYTSVDPGILVTQTLARSTKIASPVWTSAYAPSGTKAYYLIHNGSGVTVSDITGSYDGTINGSLTWGSGTYGAFLSGFSGSAAVFADALATSNLFNGATAYPKWVAVLYRSLTSTTGQWLASFTNSANDVPNMWVGVNPNADNTIGGYQRPGNQFLPAKTRDTGFHTILLTTTSYTTAALFSDGIQVASGTGGTDAATVVNRFTIGGLRRTSWSGAASGCEIHAVICGQGEAPSPWGLHVDLINGQFLGTWAPAAGPASYTLSAAAGAFAMTTYPANLLAGKRLAADPGAFDMTGNAALFNLQAVGSWDGRIPDPSRTTWSRA